jgi:hypothetical protein
MVRGHHVAQTKGFAAETVARTMLGGTDYWYDVVAEEVIDVDEPVLYG